MMTLFNGREREKSDWIKLLQDADPRFKLIDAKDPALGTLGMIHAVWDNLNT